MAEKIKPNFFEDLIKAQTAIGVVLKDQDNPFYKSKYVDINGLLGTIKPALNENNFAILQSLTTIDGKLGMKTAIVHVSGERIEDTCPLPDIGDAQKQGSVITYFRRYCIQTFLAIQAEDDDANLATGKTMDSKQPKAANPKPQSVSQPKAKVQVTPVKVSDMPGPDLSDIPF